MTETLKNLANLAKKIAQNNGITPTKLSNVEIFRFDSIHTPPIYSVYPLSLTLTVSGAKRMICGEQILEYGAGFSAVVALDMPITAQIMQATASEPYLCVHIALDADKLLALLPKNTINCADDLSEIHALSVVETGDDLIDAVWRLLKLNDDKLKDELLPLIMQEIMLRLLHNQHGASLQKLLSQDSAERKIAQAVTFLKENFVNKISIEGLADSVAMGTTAFRQHFKAVTGFSPLQYQKQLRLQQARLLLVKNQNVAQVASLVGYESASQFSREYVRAFGNSPLQDSKQLQAN